MPNIRGLTVYKSFGVRRSALVVLTVLFAWVALLLPIGMVQADNQGIAQGYETKDDLIRPGMAVQLANTTNGTTQYVERATAEFPERVIGITTTPATSVAVIGSSKNQVYVQSNGQVLAYVSDIGGVVKKGEFLTISPLKGVLMRVGTTPSAQLATALEDADLSKAEEFDIKPGSTDTKKTKVNKILVNLDRHTFQSSQNTSNTLSRVSRALVGKDVGELRVLVSLIVFALLLVVEGGVVYGAISSSLTSLGRNPLAGKAIKRELIRVLLVALFILLIGLGVVYTILWV